MGQEDDVEGESEGERRKKNEEIGAEQESRERKKKMSVRDRYRYRASIKIRIWSVQDGFKYACFKRANIVDPRERAERMRMRIARVFHLMHQPATAIREPSRTRRLMSPILRISFQFQPRSTYPCSGLLPKIT